MAGKRGATWANWIAPNVRIEHVSDLAESPRARAHEAPGQPVPFDAIKYLQRRAVARASRLRASDDVSRPTPGKVVLFLSSLRSASWQRKAAPRRSSAQLSSDVGVDPEVGPTSAEIPTIDIPGRPGRSTRAGR